MSWLTLHLSSHVSEFKDANMLFVITVANSSLWLSRLQDAVQDQSTLEESRGCRPRQQKNSVHLRLGGLQALFHKHSESFQAHTVPLCRSKPVLHM